MLSDMLATAGVADRDTVNCDWESSQSLRVRGAPGKVLSHATTGGPWLIPGTWWSPERGLTVFEAAEWPGTGAVAELTAITQGATLVWRENGKQLIVSIPATVSVQAVKPADLWYERLPRIAGQLPDFPVKQAYVQIFAETGAVWSDTHWRSPTAVGLTLSRSWSNTDIDEVGTKALIAVWPRVNIPGWKLYSVLMQGLPLAEEERLQDGLFAASFSVGTANAPSTFVDAGQQVIQRVTGRPDVIGLITSLGGPRVLFLRDRFGRCGGGIRLLTKDAAREGGTSKVAIDFGTSHSAACWGEAAGSSSVLALKGMARGWSDPAIVRGANDQSVESPWLLGRPASAFESEHKGEMTYIPSGLFLRAITDTAADAIDDWSAKVPFVDYCLMGPAVNFESRSKNAMHRWRAGLKWSENDNASQAFLTALLIWITAVRRGEGATLRFSFPHAFSEHRRELFGDMLKGVASRAGELTGASFELARPCFPTKDDESPRPFVDEATPVIWQVMDTAVATFLHLNERKRQAVLVADLGGGTLDLLLAAVEADDSRRDFRLVAAESIQFGARAVIELIKENVVWKFQNAEHQEPSKLKEALLEQWTRSGQLLDTIANARDGSPSKVFVGLTSDWKGQPQSAAQAIVEQVCLYFLFVREYCARFVGGVLTSPQLGERITTKTYPPGAGSGRRTEVGPRAPGTGSIDWSGTADLDLAIALTGNGWRFLELAGFDRLLIQSQIEDVFRASVRERTAAYAALSSVGEISLEGMGTQPKLITCLGTLRLDDRLGEGRRTVEVAPNGCEDVVSRVVRHWGSFVSPAEAHYDLPLQQVSRNIAPPLTSSGDNWFRECVWARSAARRYGQLKFDSLSADTWNRVVARQGTGPGSRQISTARALWETVVRGYLGLAASK